MRDRVLEAAVRHGFQAAALWPIRPLTEELHVLRGWIARGFIASMVYLQGHARGMSLGEAMPWARGGITFLVRWDALHHGHEGPWAPLVATYARGVDYHPVIAARLRAIADELGFVRYRVGVDATVLPERALARRAGLGWIGKNRFLTHPILGGDVCLAELVVDRLLDVGDAEVVSAPCGDCVLCMDACPTGALTSEGVDARRCLAYHGSQNRAGIPRELRKSMTSLLGCDLCLKACPHGKAARVLERRDEGFLGMLVATRSHEEFSALAGTSPLHHGGREMAVRNAVIVAATQQRDDLENGIADALSSDSSPMVRAHAAWALGRFVSGRTRRVLNQRHGIEHDPRVREEIEKSLG